jgi:hypothetical protein
MILVSEVGICHYVIKSIGQWAAWLLVFLAMTTRTFGLVVQYQTVNAGLTGTEIREIRDGKLAGFRYQNSIIGTRNFEEGFVTNIITKTSSIESFPSSVSTQIYAISTTDNNRYGGMVYFGEILPTRVYGFLRGSDGGYSFAEPPNVSNSSVEGIYGNISVGWAVQNGKRSGFIRVDSATNSSYFKVDYNKAGFAASTYTEATGVFGEVVVGTTIINGITYGFGCNISTGVFSDPFLAPSSTATFFNDYNDGFIAGTATIGGVNTPFILDPSTTQPEYFISPQGYSASGRSYDNGILAGSYTTSSGEKLGFYANVPEPNMNTLILVGAIFLFLIRHIVNRRNSTNS